MKAKIAILIAVLAVAFCVSSFAENVKPGKNRVDVRGQSQDIYFFPANGGASRGKVLFAPGDGGWRGFAIDIAKQLQNGGYDVYGLDTRRYLQSFAGNGGLKTSDIPRDFGLIAQWIRQDSSHPLLLAGWSEGAGLALAAAADSRNKGVFAGLVVIGMAEKNLLAWHWSDTWAEIAKTVPNEPTFPSAQFVSQVAPLPLFVIASSNDEYSTVPATRALFAQARDPKKLVVVDAKDHKYGGNTDTFFRTLKEALIWITQQQHK
jgi:pimeloyl-ACP methyl ester carboxylesterase